MHRRLTPAAGSFLWLVHHDIRLSWRGFSHLFATFTATRARILACAGLIVLHLVAWPLAAVLAPRFDAAIVPGETGTAAVVALSVLAWMTAQGLIGASRALFARSDLELLLGSPIDARAIFGARAMAIATSTFGSVGLLVLPIVNVGALQGKPNWVLAYPILVVLALLGTAFGLAVAMLIWRLAGPLRARLMCQLAATVIAGGFVLGVQVWLLLPEGVRALLAVAAADVWSAEPRWMPPLTGLLMGRLEPMLLVTALSIALFVGTIFVLAGPFARATLSAAGAPPDGRRPAAHDRPLRFTSGFARTLRRKEWRLLLRDPGIYGQLTLQIIYTLPVAVMLLHSNHTLPDGMAIAVAVVVIAAQVSASLAWIAVSAEEAPELLATAPSRAGRIDRCKLAAIAVPVLTIVAVPTIGIAVVSVRVAVLTFALATLAAGSTALLNLWHPMPGNRRGMLRRHQQSKLIGLVEHGLAMLWALGTILALHAAWLIVFPSLIATAILWATAPFRPMQALRGAIRRGLRRSAERGADLASAGPLRRIAARLGS